MSSSSLDDASSGAMYAAVPMSEVMSTARLLLSTCTQKINQESKHTQGIHHHVSPLNQRRRTQTRAHNVNTTTQLRTGAEFRDYATRRTTKKPDKEQPTNQPTNLLRNPKVAEEDRQKLVQQHVLRLEVAVHHVSRVQEVDGGQHFGCHPQNHKAVGLRIAVHVLPQTLLFQLGNEVVRRPRKAGQKQEHVGWLVGWLLACLLGSRMD